MTDDRLSKIFKEQKDFQYFFYNPEIMSEDEKVKFTKEYILSLHKELSEVLDTIPWKLHRKHNKIKSTNNISEELIDCFKFLLNLFIIWGISAEEFSKEFFRKSLVVKQRYNQEILKAIDSNEKICAIDLDDTLARSSDYFVNIYNRKNNTKFKTRAEIKEKISLLDYEEYKEYFRESGIKLNIPVFEEAKKTCSVLKQMGYRIVIISARPYNKYNRIFSDTLEWLNTNDIVYDAVYFEENKHIKILKELPNVSFVIEDNPIYAKEIAEQKYKVFLLPGPHEDKIEERVRKKLKENKYVKHVNSLSDIIKEYNS